MNAIDKSKAELAKYDRAPIKADPRQLGVSTTLKSTSKYLNHPRLREWVMTEYLRKDGPDFDSYEPVLALYEICNELIDVEQVNSLFRAARHADPALDRWFERGFLGNYSDIGSLATLPEGTLGHTFWREVIDKRDLTPDFLPGFTPTNEWEYWLRRAQQTHDIHHIVTDCNFDQVAEGRILAIYLANWMTHLPPALAGQLLTYNSLISASGSLRVALHNPEAWLGHRAAQNEGHVIGTSMAPLYLPDWETMWDRPLEDIRRELGVIQPAQRVDTLKISEMLQAA